MGRSFIIHPRDTFNFGRRGTCLPVTATVTRVIRETRQGCWGRVAGRDRGVEDEKERELEGERSNRAGKRNGMREREGLLLPRIR